MWHYGSDGTTFTVRVDIDVAKRSARYERTYPGAGPGTFRIVIGDDGTWVTTLEILRPDGTRLKVMEFRMKRLAGGEKGRVDLVPLPKDQVPAGTEVWLTE